MPFIFQRTIEGTSRSCHVEGCVNIKIWLPFLLIGCFWIESYQCMCRDNSCYCQLKQGLIGDQDLNQLGSNLHEALFLTCEQLGNVASLEANETKHISCHVPLLILVADECVG